ncbi:MAG: hypothetical protein R2732_06475 [Microbacteriaceae bacterium]|nr:hypothetical protein [Microbacteriaceae bacterium]HPZ35086.1 hypothetical protein [Microbacteriaceae bacterium]HQC92466.1 hypothetical protein [Microbacteriaceae bacterium]
MAEGESSVSHDASPEFPAQDREKLESPAPLPAAQPRRISKVKVGALLTTILTIIGTVGTLIVVFDIFARDRTNFSHLQMSVQPVDDEITDWAVPADALDSFPADGQVCGPAQFAWLEEHGTRLQRRFMLSVRNNASEGAMLALTDFRSTSPKAAERGPISIRLVCDPRGAPASQLVYARIDADDASTTARHVRAVEDAASTSAPEIPVAYNLAPGESGLIPLELFSRAPAEGAISVAVLSGSAEQILTLEGSEFSLPALLYAGDMHMYTTNDGLMCRLVQRGTITTCTIDDLQRELQIAR